MDRERRPLLRRPLEENVRLGRRTIFACAAVLVTEAFERIAFYGIIGNLVLFLNHHPFDWMSTNAVNAMFLFTGISYVSSLLSGWIADSYLGKYKSIIFYLLVYIAGYVFFPLLAKDPYWCLENNHKQLSTTIAPNRTGEAQENEDQNMLDGNENTKLGDENCFWVVGLALVVIAIGNGGVKSSIAPFGADQVRKIGPNTTRSFFNWFYWCINIGSLVSLGVLAYVQQDINFFYGYLIPSIFLALSLVAFLIGSGAYERRPAGGSVLSNVCKVLCEGISRRSRRSRASSSFSVDTADLSHEARYGCLDGAKVRYGGSFHDNLVDDVKSLGKILLVFSSLIPYWMVYFQMETTYPLQGLHMRLRLSGNGSYNTSHHHDSFSIPTAWLSLFDVVFILIMLPLFDRLIYPWLDRKGYAMSLRLRITIGLLCAAMSVLVAGFVEMHRLNVYWDHNSTSVTSNNTYFQQVGHTLYYAADMSIMWQIPQYALIGISEVFASVACLELAYTCAPRTMVSLIMGLFWCAQGFGGFLGSATYALFRDTLFFYQDYGDINCRFYQGDKLRSCHLDYYFFFLAGVQLLATFLFLGFTVKVGIGGNKNGSKSILSQSASATNQNTRDNRADSNETNDNHSYNSNGNTPQSPYRRSNIQDKSLSESSSTMTS